MKVKKDITERGFGIIEFVDLYGTKCNIQKSSLSTKDAIWMGVIDANPQIMESKIKDGGTGWVKYPILEDVSLTTRMHLSISQVKTIIEILQKFVDTGKI